MPISATRHTLQRIMGWFIPTPVEIGLLALVAVIVIWGVVPHVERWRATQLLEDEQEMVMRVRAALATQREVMHRCPDRLDNCADGANGEDCRFFSRVFGNAERLPGWSKVRGTYRGPAGGYYRYDPLQCRIVRVSEPADER